MQKRVIISFVLCIVVSGVIAQSDISMATHWYNRANYNPASIVRNNYIYLFSNVRKQWLGVDGSPSVVNVQVSQLNYEYHSAFGLSVVCDYLGAGSAINPMLTYAYKLGKSEDTWLAFGLSAGVFSRQTDLAVLQATNQTDPAIYSLPEKQLAPDANFGLEWQMPYFMAGASVTHLFSINKKETLYLNSPHYYGYAQYRNRDSEFLDYAVGALFTYSNAQVIAEGNVLLRFKTPTGLNDGPRELFDLGLGFSSASQLTSIFSLNISGNFRIGYSYIQTFNTGYNLNGTHELMLEYRIPSVKASACQCHSELSWYF